ncbi:unnamed protein product [Rodentolepis nana]|uniref:Integrase n=1 Tax=Rodentolepis nana TaxID=102285 RepID=A0A0R3TJQ3_RODNA|nr:unnamed protein product [Rodentolepis nana]
MTCAYRQLSARGLMTDEQRSNLRHCKTTASINFIACLQTEPFEESAPKTRGSRAREAGLEPLTHAHGLFQGDVRIIYKGCRNRYFAHWIVVELRGYRHFTRSTILIIFKLQEPTIMHIRFTLVPLQSSLTNTSHAIVPRSVISRSKPSCTHRGRSVSPPA